MYSCYNIINYYKLSGRKIMMNITDTIINNYKSIGNERNVLSLDQNSTAIIGKNESGKSNVLEAIGNLPYFNKPNQGYYQNNKNRRLNKDISIIIKMQLVEDDIVRFNAKNTETVLTFTNGITVSISGALSEIIAKDNELLTNIDKIVKTKGDRKVWNIGSNERNRNQHNNIMNNLKNCSKVIALNFKQNINSLKKQLISSNEDYEELFNLIDSISSTLSNYYALIPKIFYRKKDLQLEYSYDLEKVEKSIKHKNDIFYRLMLTADISENDMLRAFSEKIEGEKQNIRLKIEDKLSKNIGEKFNEFYTQETVKFNPRFRNKTLNFILSTNKGEAMLITERSNGLRWYLSLFIDILANDIENSSVLFLFDEPGVHLHVNAQKELLSLFDDLCKNGNQVVYTTHSPSMIDGENIFNIRVVKKEHHGDTLIFNNSYDQNLSSDSKMETLSPLIKAIGADMKFNLGPQYHKLNIITEGITDYMYIKALIYHFNIEEHPNIIPSAGVNNINRIASILTGWGYDFKILLDHDKQGVEEYETLTDKLSLTLSEKIVFVNGKSKPLREEIETAPIETEDLISEIGRAHV